MLKNHTRLFSLANTLDYVRPVEAFVEHLPDCRVRDMNDQLLIVLFLLRLRSIVVFGLDPLPWSHQHSLRVSYTDDLFLGGLAGCSEGPALPIDVPTQ